MMRNTPSTKLTTTTPTFEKAYKKAVLNLLVASRHCCLRVFARTEDADITSAHRWDSEARPPKGLSLQPEFPYLLRLHQP